MANLDIPIKHVDDYFEPAELNLIVKTINEKVDKVEISFFGSNLVAGNDPDDTLADDTLFYDIVNHIILRIKDGYWKDIQGEPIVAGIIYTYLNNNYIVKDGQLIKIGEIDETKADKVAPVFLYSASITFNSGGDPNGDIVFKITDEHTSTDFIQVNDFGFINMSQATEILIPVATTGTAPIQKQQVDSLLLTKADKIQLKSVTIQPVTHNVGDKYYNSTNNHIHEYRRYGSNWNWGPGVTPELGIIYTFDGSNYLYELGNGLIKVNRNLIDIPKLKLTVTERIEDSVKLIKTALQYNNDAEFLKYNPKIVLMRKKRKKARGNNETSNWNISCKKNKWVETGQKISDQPALLSEIYPYNTLSEIRQFLFDITDSGIYVPKFQIEGGKQDMTIDYLMDSYINYKDVEIEGENVRRYKLINKHEWIDNEFTFSQVALFGLAIRINNPNYQGQKDGDFQYQEQQRYLYGDISKILFHINMKSNSGELAKSISVL